VVVSGSNILKLTIEGPDPEIATRLANTLGQHAIDYISKIYQAYDVNVLDIARQPEAPASPRPLRDAAIATALGLILGCLLAITSEELRAPLALLQQRMTTDRVSTALSKKYFLTSLDKERVSRPDSMVTLALLSFTGLEDFMEGFPEALSIKLLRNITSKLRYQLHGNDIVCRWNETTFGILLPDTPAEPAIRTIERIRGTFVTPMSIESNTDMLYLAPVAGISTSEDGANTITLVRQAELALQNARLDHKPIVLYDQEMEKLSIIQAEAELN
jgi:GGDEF domain-containing protein